MASKKTATAEEQQAVTESAPQEAKQVNAPDLKTENDELKSMLKDMQAMMQQMQGQLVQQQEQIQRMAAGEVKPEKPKTQTDLDSEAIQKIAKETAEKGEDPWGVEVEVFVPHRDKGEDRWYWISINDRTAQIPADDRRQKMKLPFALILTDMIRAKEREDNFIDSIEVYDPKTNPHQGRP